MAFSLLAAAVPYVTETAVAVGGTVTEATGSQLLGGAATGFVIDKAGQALEAGTTKAVDTLFGEGTTQKTKDSLYDTYEKAQALGIFSSDGMSNEDIVKRLREQKMSHKQITENVASFGHDFSKQMSEQPTPPNNSTVANILTNLSKVNPVYFYLAEKFLSKTGEFFAPTDEDYKRISEIYNGEGIYGQETVQDEVGFSLFDETGTKRQWKYEYNDYTVIPPIWGTWVGINSPNNTKPISYIAEDGNPVESYLDQICMLHDISYQPPDRGGYGLFSKVGDYMLISRALYGKRNGLYKMPNEELTADVAINYFSTLGRVMRRMYGSDGVSVDSVISDLYKDVYDVNLTQEHIDELKVMTKQDIPSFNTPTGGVSTDTRVNQLVSLINGLQFDVL